MGVTINFVIFRPAPWAKLALYHVDFVQLTALWERMSVSYVWPQYSLDHKVQAWESDNRVKFRVSNEWRDAEFMSKFPAFEHWLSTRLWYLQWVC